MRAFSDPFENQIHRRHPRPCAGDPVCKGTGPPGSGWPRSAVDKLKSGKPVFSDKPALTAEAQRFNETGECSTLERWGYSLCCASTSVG
ncbi:hypothetical protein CHELA40_11697 [Chelatococcus asaccharovorans]|nr:hypothetical protein CHELA40_11697 [Chelatococcus asaccharovorans]CAH1684251.1 hypothetical protein CHELA17_63906 [Chelatococcus asaccharovorans]